MTRRTNQKIDPVSGITYVKEVYAPEIKVKAKKVKAKEIEADEEAEEEGEEEEEDLPEEPQVIMIALYVSTILVKFLLLY